MQSTRRTLTAFIFLCTLSMGLASCSNEDLICNSEAEDLYHLDSFNKAVKSGFSSPIFNIQSNDSRHKLPATVQIGSISRSIYITAEYPPYSSEEVHSAFMKASSLDDLYQLYETTATTFKCFVDSMPEEQCLIVAEDHLNRTLQPTIDVCYHFLNERGIPNDSIDALFRL